MSLVPGTRLGPYEIVAPLGAGGMGEVFRARDTRLSRDVAIKVLPAHASSDPERRERFEREAQLISSLNHPNICTLFDVGRDGDTSYLVMELLEGETLAARLAHGPLKLDAALKIAGEMASALGRAHAAGIVHRDLKPQNVVLTRSGAKVLDFGIAKLTETRTGVDSGHLPTRTTPLTAQGSIVGTLSYMAPEQLEGKAVDHRADIFSLGAVLYEMLTGKRAFDGASQASIIAAILEREPALPSSLDPAVPASVDRLVADCLAKDPEERRQSARDLATELRSSAAGTGTGAQRVQRPAPRATVAWSVAALATIAAAVLGIAATRRAPPQTVATVELEIQQQTESNPFSIAISPDHASVVYVRRETSTGKTELWIRRLADAEPHRLEGTAGGYLPFWSPDGREIAFINDDSIRAVSAAGGIPREICASDYGVGAAWGDDGTIVFSPSFNQGLRRVDAAGGASREITTLDKARGESGHLWPVFLPGAKKLLFLCRTVAGASSRIETLTLDGNVRKVVGDADSLVGYSAPWLLFARGNMIYAQRFDADSGTLSGERRTIAEGAAYSESWASSNASVVGDVLAWHVHRPASIHGEWWLPDGRRSGPAFDEDDIAEINLSPDGTRIGMSKLDAARGASDVWTLDLARGIRTRVTNTRGSESLGPWLPDGTEISYASDDDGPYAIYRRASDGSGAARLIVSEPAHDLTASSLSPDGKDLLVDREDVGAEQSLQRISLDRPGTSSRWEASAHDPRFSPDGKWVAFLSSRSGTYSVFVRRFDGGPAIQLSAAGALGVRWQPDGKAVLFVTSDGRLMRAALRFAGDRAIPEAVSPIPEIETKGLVGLEVARDGRILAARRSADVEATGRVRVGWKNALESKN